MTINNITIITLYSEIDGNRVLDDSGSGNADEGIPQIYSGTRYP